MRLSVITKRQSERMTAKELIELARLLVLFASYVEADRAAQQEEAQLAIECLKRAQELQADPAVQPDLSDIPF
jgi:hypothetical protein